MCYLVNYIYRYTFFGKLFTDLYKTYICMYLLFLKIIKKLFYNHILIQKNPFRYEMPEGFFLRCIINLGESNLRTF